MLHEFHQAGFRKRIDTETAPLQASVDSKPVARDKMPSAA